jgi:hypothetical protein
MKKKRIVFALMASVLLVLLSSCSIGSLKKMMTEDLGVYDETVSKDRLAMLTIPRFYTVQRFGDKSVEWTASGLTAAFAEIQIPAGQHEFEYRFDKPVTGGCSAMPRREIRGRTEVLVRDCTPIVPARSFDRKVTVNIEAGKKYTVGEATITSGGE